MLPASRARISTPTLSCVCALLACALAVPLDAADEPPASGESLYRSACAACHGADGRGAPSSAVAFAEPLPDFTDCAFATREPDADWLAVVHDGGPARAFTRMMPAFGEALRIDDMRRVLGHVRT